MYRFNQALVEMGGRNLKAMTKIRENDQLAEISVSLERVRKLWTDDVVRAQNLLVKLRTALPVGAIGDEAEEKLAEMQAVFDAYKV